MNALEKYMFEKWDVYSGEPELFGLTPGGFNGSSELNIANFSKEELNWAMSFANACGEPIARINTNYSSYRLKGIAERWIAKISFGEIKHIYNGSLILAMVDAGFRFKKIAGTPNVYFNVSERAIKRFFK